MPIKLVTSRLREYLDSRGVSSKYMVQTTGINPSRLKRYARGESEPTVSDAILIADALFITDLRRIWQVEIIPDEETDPHAVPVDGQPGRATGP